ncbi:MAG TPA: PAS domain S-box protein [Candidatus Acidoferrum sp.]
MADSATAKRLTRPGASFARRYGLALASVAGALLLDLLFHHFNLPHSFAAFAMSAIAITFWYGGTKPGIVAVLLSSLIRGFIFEGETSGLSRVLYELVFLVFAILMIWVRRRREALEVSVADRTARLTAVNEDLLRRREQLDGLFELSPDAVILTDNDFHVLRVNKEFTRIFGYTAEEVAGQWLPQLIVPEDLRAEALKHRDSLISGNRVDLETIRQHKGGVRFDVSVVAKGMSLGSNQVGIYLIYRDITERKKVERKLRRSEANLLESQRLMHMCSWAYDPSSQTVTFSPEVKRIYDIKSDQDTWPADFFLDKLHPEDRPVVEEIFRRAQLDKTDYDVSYRIVLPDGSIKHIYSVAHPVLNESGELVEFVGTSMDVTEQWKAAEALRRSEGYLAEAQRLSHTGTFGWSIPSGELFWSEETFQIFQYDRTTKPTVELVLQRVYPEDAVVVKQTIERASQDGKDFQHEYRLLMPDGSIKYVHALAHAWRDKSGGLEFVGAVTDVTPTKRAEEALRKSEDRWRSVFENSAIGVALTDLNGRFLATNHVYQTMVGYTEEELRALRFLDVTHEDCREANWALITELLEGKRRQFQIEKKYRRKDGTSIWVSNNVSLVPGTETVPRFIMALSEDVTERKRAEEKLQRSEADLLEAQRMSRTGSLKLDVSSGTVTGSPQVYRIFGVKPDEDTSTSEFWLSRTHPEDQKRIQDLFHRSIIQKTDFDADYRIVLPDGAIKHLHAVGHPVLNESGDLVQFGGTITDITERKQAEEALRRSEGYLAEAQKLTHTGSWAWNVRTGALFWSQEVFRIYDYVPQEGLTWPQFLERVHLEDRPQIEQRAKMEASEKDWVDSQLDFRIVLPHGTIKHLHSVAHPVRDESDEITEVVGTVMDVTEQWKARTELEKAFEEIKRLKDQLHDENLALREQIDQAFMFEEIVGSSPALQNVVSSIVKVAPTDSTVLITGETGTGKELIARAIHKHSQRSGQAFISVNCASIPSSLIASELFGHEKGAFTGAVQRHQGRFELAHSGTIFLDEVGDLPAEMQVALLRVLQERQFERVGGNRLLPTDVRVIAATNRDLTAAIAAGTFRADLFYRLNVFPIEVPPLRKRKEDIPMLVEYFVKRYAEKTGKQIRKIEKNTLELCQSYPWPGNIRELQNIVERSVILCNSDTFWIEKAWLESEQERRPELSGPLPDTLQNQEKEIIEAALAESKGKIAGPEGAAARLGIPRSTLDSKIKQLNIKKQKFAAG